MVTLNKAGQRLAAVTLAAALLVPASAFADKRPERGTARAQTAAQVIERILQKQQERKAAAARKSTKPRQAAPKKRPVEKVRPAAPRTGSVSATELVDEMNRRRAAAGLPRLRLNSTLSAAAGDRARDMFEQRYFDHVAPDGTQPFVWAKSRGYRYSLIGENLAMGQRSAEQVVDQWMSSPGHRANILGRGFRDAGIAIVPGSPVGGSRGYTFVVLYGTERYRTA